MSTGNKRVLIAALVVIGLYVFVPFFAGIFKTYDRRGPKIFARDHHELLYRFGYHMAGHHHHDGKPRVPYMQERSWIYGIQGKRIPEQRIREKVEAVSQEMNRSERRSEDEDPR